MAYFFLGVKKLIGMMMEWQNVTEDVPKDPATQPDLFAFLSAC